MNVHLYICVMLYIHIWYGQCPMGNEHWASVQYVFRMCLTKYCLGLGHWNSAKAFSSCSRDGKSFNLWLKHNVRAQIKRLMEQQWHEIRYSLLETDLIMNGNNPIPGLSSRMDWLYVYLANTTANTHTWTWTCISECWMCWYCSLRKNGQHSIIIDAVIVVLIAVIGDSNCEYIKRTKIDSASYCVIE